MGQYYFPMILDSQGIIVVWMDATNYKSGMKFLEHAYIGNQFVSTFEYGLSRESIYYKSRVVWAGDYADAEPKTIENLSHMRSEYNLICPRPKNTDNYRFVVNHTKRQFVDKNSVKEHENGYRIHPLPFLTVEGNGRGGGDYFGSSELIGSWARDVISVEQFAPDESYVKIRLDV
jgi:hypothetical protein